jgi:hypothetical protein
MAPSVWSVLLPGDEGDRFQFAVVLAWILLAGGLIAAAGLFGALVKHWITLTGFLIALVLLPLALWGVARLVFAAVSRTSHGVVQAIMADGNLTPASSFSLEEAMLLRGEAAAAATLLGARLADRPDDLAIRFKLAGVLRDHLADPDGAARLYLEARARPSGVRHEDAIANALIDLYERTGKRGRLMVEYARFAQRRPGTPAGAAARRRLAELKEDG